MRQATNNANQSSCQSGTYVRFKGKKTEALLQAPIRLIFKSLHKYSSFPNIHGLG